MNFFSIFIGIFESFEIIFLQKMWNTFNRISYSLVVIVPFNTSFIRYFGVLQSNEELMRNQSFGSSSRFFEKKIYYFLLIYAMHYLNGDV